jgi:hypothetical protein
MPSYVRHTRSIQLDELPPRLRNRLAQHAESREIDLRNVRVWITHSENPLTGSGFGKLLRRRANPSDSDEEHWTVVVLHSTQLLVVVDGAKRGTSALSLPLLQASLSAATGPDGPFPEAADPAGFTLNGFSGDQVGSFYVGLGPEAAAGECVSTVRSAIAAAKNR